MDHFGAQKRVSWDELKTNLAKAHWKEAGKLVGKYLARDDESLIVLDCARVVQAQIACGSIARCCVAVAVSMCALPVPIRAITCASPRATRCERLEEANRAIDVSVMGSLFVLLRCGLTHCASTCPRSSTGFSSPLPRHHLAGVLEDLFRGPCAESRALRPPDRVDLEADVGMQCVLKAH